MKRYLLFAGDYRYPKGGWNDFVDSYDSTEEARASERLSPGPPREGPDWWEIIDSQTGVKVEFS